MRANRSNFRFAHVHLKCRDFEATKYFYKRMFGARLLFEERVRGARIAMMEIGGAYLHISETEQGELLESAKAPRSSVWLRYGLGHFGFRVDDLDAAVRELQAKGAEFLGGIRNIREGVRVIYIRGPEEDIIEISERSPAFEALLEGRESPDSGGKGKNAGC